MAENYFEMASREAATDTSALVITVEGLEELAKALKDFGDGWEEIARDALGIGMATLESAAKVKAPWDTGRLRASIGSNTAEGINEISRTGSEIVAKLGSRVEYASYQEFGTKYQSGKPYLRPALEENVGKVVRQFEEGIVKALQKLRLMDR